MSSFFVEEILNRTVAYLENEGTRGKIERILEQMRDLLILK